ncbi:hypothetical protein ERJ75_000291000 [Trypanosoma vivax]|nr:hypothetical protein ERJ75_000291000 [Trypanosoma vivax]
MKILAALNKHSVSFSAPKQQISVPLVVDKSNSELHLDGLYIEGMKVKMLGANKLEVSMRSVTAIVPETNYTPTMPKLGSNFSLDLFIPAALNGKFWGQPSSTDSTVIVDILSDSNKKPKINVRNVSVQLSDLNLGVCSDDSSQLGRVLTLSC